MGLLNFGKKKGKISHHWEYLPYFTIHDNLVMAVQVCKKTNACRYIRVPSMKKLAEMEDQASKLKGDAE